MHDRVRRLQQADTSARDSGATAGSASTSRAAKATLRAQSRRLRASLSAEPWRAARIAQRVNELLGRNHAACVGFYWPVAGEVDLRDTVADWLSVTPAARAALPVIDADTTRMRFCAWTPRMEMRAGLYGIDVPADPIPVSPDMLLIPCVAFDASGFRLGYGGGYYDRALAVAAPPLAIGIAFDDTRVAALPVETHDAPLDCVVTEQRCYGRRADLCDDTRLGNHGGD